MSGEIGTVPSVPPGWMPSTLEDFCTITQGQSPPGETYNTAGKGLPFLQGKAEFGPLYPTPVKWCSEPARVSEPDDVLISIRAPVGPTNLSPTVCCIGRGLAAIRPIGGASARYVLYSLRATESQLAAKATGSTFAAIGGSDLRRHCVPLAPVREQHRIVAEIETQFTRLDAVVAALKRVQATLKRHRAAVLKAACEGRLVPTEAALARREGRAYEPAGVLLDRTVLAQGERVDQKLRTGTGQGAFPAPGAAQLSDLPEGWCWSSLDRLLYSLSLDFAP